MTTTDTSTDLLTVPQVCARLPGKGCARVHHSTVTRWILYGCPDRGGRRVKLGATRVGSRWLVAPADLAAFFAALAGPSAPPSATPAPTHRTEAERRDVDARASAELARRGA